MADSFQEYVFKKVFDSSASEYEKTFANPPKENSRAYREHAESLAKIAEEEAKQTNILKNLVDQITGRAGRVNSGVREVFSPTPGTRGWDEYRQKRSPIPNVGSGSAEPNVSQRGTPVGAQKGTPDGPHQHHKQGVRGLWKDTKGIFGSEGEISTVPDMLRRGATVYKSALMGRYGTGGQAIAGALTLGGASSALAGFQGNIERLYQRQIGGDINQALSYGLDGHQGAGSILPGLVNRFLEPFGMLGMNVPFIGSDAQKFAFSDRIDSFKAALNPFDSLSLADDKNIKSMVRGRGYRVGSQQADDVINTLRDLKRKGFEPGQAIEYIDLFTKKFGQRAQDAGRELDTFRDKAQIAGKSLEEYTSQVTQVAQNLLMKGVSPTNANLQAQVAASFPGMDASQFNSITGTVTPDLLMRAMSQNPELFKNPMSMAAFLQNPQMMLGEDLGMYAVDIVEDAMNRARTMAGPDASDEEVATMAKAISPQLKDLDVYNILKIHKGGREKVKAAQTFGRAVDEATTAQTLLDELKSQREIPLAWMGDPNSPKGRRAKQLELDIKKAEEDLQPFYDEMWSSIDKGYDLTKDQDAEIKEMIDAKADPMEIQNAVNEFLRINSGEMQEVKLTIDSSPKLKEFFEFVQDKKVRYTNMRTNDERNAANLREDATTRARARMKGVFGG
jgi:hypothetical protein